MRLARHLGAVSMGCVANLRDLAALLAQGHTRPRQIPAFLAVPPTPSRRFAVIIGVEPVLQDRLFLPSLFAQPSVPKPFVSFAMRAFLCFGLVVALFAVFCASADAQGLNNMQPGGGGTSVNVGNGQGLQSSSTVGQVNSNARYLRDSSSAGGFVGGGQSQGFTGQVNASNNSGTRSGVGGGNRNSTFTNRNTKFSSNEIRARLSIGFETPTPSPASQTARLERRIQNSHWIKKRLPISVIIADDGTAVLQGTVDRPYDRLLAERLVRLESGVSRIDNQLAIAGEEGETAQP